MKMMQFLLPTTSRSLFCAMVLVMVNFAHAQSADTTRNSVYRIRWGVDIPITAAAMATNFIGLQLVGDKAEFTTGELNALDPADVNSFDRSATRQDESFREQANTISDWTMNTSFALPALLMFDKRIRPDGLRLLVMYLETEAIVGNLYSFGAANWVDRTRPLAYHPEVDLEDRLEANNRNSFYSGHTASTACATFFAAKVYSDYHPELGGKKYMFYGLAMIPPTITGYLRYKAMKHFPTDIIVGGVVGAATGILIPQLHKRTKKGYEMGFAPQMGNAWGASAYFQY